MAPLHIVYGESTLPDKIVSADGVEIALLDRFSNVGATAERVITEVAGLITIAEPDSVSEAKAGPVLMFTVDMGRPLHRHPIVPAPSEKPMFFGKTKYWWEKVPRVVFDVPGTPMTEVKVEIFQQPDGNYTLLNAHIKMMYIPPNPTTPLFKPPRTPEMEERFQESLAFWRTHAETRPGPPNEYVYESTWEAEINRRWNPTLWQRFQRLFGR